MSSTAKLKALGVRHGQMLLLFVSLCINFSLCSNLSVAIVAMTEATDRLQPVILTSAQKGVVLGIMGYGCIISSIPSGILTNRYGARHLLGTAMLVSSLMTVLFPVLSINYGYVGACISRSILGICQGVVYPSISHHIARWSPKEERGFFIATVYTGISVGMVIMESAAGIIASVIGWPFIFHISGAISALWSFIWFAFARNSAKDHERITLEERRFIEKDSSTYTDSHQKRPIPWLNIATSIPFWSLIVVQCGFVYGKTIQDSLLPSYLKEVFHIKVRNSGFLSSLPPAATVLSSALVPFIGSVTEKCCSRMSLTWRRKIWSSLALYGGALLYLAISQLELGPGAAIACLTIAKSLVACHHLGMMCGDVDLSPNFAGILNGIDAGVAGNLGLLLAPVFAGLMLHDESNRSDWGNVFLSGSLMQLVTTTFYLIFGSAEVQKWNEPSPNESLKEVL